MRISGCYHVLIVALWLVAGSLVSAGAAPSAEKKAAEDKDAEKKREAEKKEVAMFQGTWRTVSIENDGESAVPEDELKELVLTIEGNKRTLKVGDAVRSVGTYRLDPAQKPKAIDITVSEGPLKDKTVRGIYEIDGETQKICLALDGETRPKEFTSKPGSGHLLQVFRREKK